ncbi:(4Fe-4S)-binding protein [Streptomyces sp. H10-C2]|uniref:(4Fe-4S)-binding protein n=1 Tax=unclassified Streptomyces TaxID=2593676 RepID=UPI0024B96F78|nr:MULTISPECIES: (4Fe-4S)-binding protein [unclassified Streptomyces]MDJ0342381.1 (4Fe-4S)-binding protein [Streptomyces sp. PH10-H1]MDJ0372236.1 (4Fe-4S)-binding protein [Streptomyces sp. H10-C2]
MSAEVPIPEDARPYPGAVITVTFETARCLHSGECVRGLPQVFDSAARPWIRPDAAPADLVTQIIRRCPSGALQYRIDGGRPEEPTHPTEISRSSSGGITVRGDLVIHTGGAARIETRAVLCGCGATGRAPYCDRTGLCGTAERGPDGRSESSSGHEHQTMKVRP